MLQFNNGSEFKNGIVDDFLKSQNVKSIHSIAYKPTSQRAIKRFNQTLKHLTQVEITKLDNNV